MHCCRVSKSHFPMPPWCWESMASSLPGRVRPHPSRVLLFAAGLGDLRTSGGCIPHPHLPGASRPKQEVMGALKGGQIISCACINN